MTGFTILGLWVVMIMVTFIFVSLLACCFNFRWMPDHDMEALVSSLVIFVVVLEMILGLIYLRFKNNPEEFGYTRIEQEVEEVTNE